MKSTAKGRRHRHPCVLSCGYRSVYIPKSGLFFPAWLVCFDDSDDDDDDDDEAPNKEQGDGRVANIVNNKRQKQQSEPSATTAAAMEQVVSAVETVVSRGRKGYWRSKRDFLRLARAVSAASSSSSLVFPKAAWKKLSNEAPWQRPDYNDYNVGEEEQYQAHDDALEERNQQNGWKRHMYKSLRQVDQYLQQVQSLCRKSNQINNNHQPDSAEKVEAEQEQLQCRTSSSARSIQDAWQEFCRPCDTESLLVVGDEESTPAAASPVTAMMMKGNALGQYFCHPTNARQLVKVCLERVFVHQQALVHDATTTTRTRYLFVEPSCGHGQVLEVLLEELKLRQRSSSPELDLKHCSFVGMDIDPAAIAHCREHFSQKQQYPNITWTNQDFLQSKRACIISNLQMRQAGNEAIMVIVLGGPPYSAGAGNGGNMKLDLPMRFVEHAMDEWGASVVTFFMPERCGRASHTSTYNSDDGNRGGPERDVDTNEDSMIRANENDRNNRPYSMTNIPLEAPSVFYFQGLSSAPVTQPSIIQCFYREEADRSKAQVL